MLKQRIITGLVLAPITIACVFVLPTPYFALFCTLAILIGAWEWGPLMGIRQIFGRCALVGVIAAILASLALLSPLELMWSESDQLAPLYFYILLAAAIWWCLSVLLIVSYPNSASVWQSNQLLRGLMGILTLVPAWVAFIAIRTIDIDEKFYFGGFLLFASLLIVWAADIGAYFSGKKFGKRKLMPKVSPNKTIEGFVGGLVWVAILVVILNVIFDVPSELYPIYLLIALLTAVVSAVGDLSESMLKRSAGVKDSGSILPGHGGLLDRIDSLVAATPVFILLYSSFVI